MKKILSLLLVCALCLTTLAQLPAVASSKDDGVIFYQTYDDVTTHTQPTVGDFLAQESYVADAGKGNKELVMRSNKDGYIKLEYTGFTLPEEFGFSVDMAIPSGKLTGDITLTGAGSKSVKALNFTASEGMKNPDGYRIGGLKKQTQRLTVLYNAKKSVYSIYINDKCVNSNYYIKSSALVKDVTSLRITLYPEGDDVLELRLDNLHIYEGAKLRKLNNLPKAAYNSNSIDYEQAKLESKESVYFQRDWEEPTFQPFIEMSKIIQKGSTATMEVYEEEDGNHYVKWVDDGKGNQLRAMTIYPSTWTGDAQADKRFIILQYDMSGDDIANSKITVQLEDGIRTTTRLFGTSGYDITADGKTVGTLSKDKWTNIAAAMDIATRTYDVYVDYKKVASNVAFTCSTFGYPNMMNLVGNGGTVHIDNIAIYSGREPRPIRYNNYETISMIRADRADLSVMKSMQVLNTNSKRLYNGLNLIAEGDHLFVEKNDTTYINIEEIGKMYGANITVNGTTAKFGEKSVSGVITENNISYAPYDKLFEAFGKKVYSDERGIIIAYVGELDTLGYGERIGVGLWDIFDYTNYDRPSAEKLVSDFKMSNTHPRLVHTREDVERIKANIASDEFIRKMYERKLNAANGYLGASHIEPELNYTKNNATSRSQLTRIMSLSEAYLISGDKKYADQVWADLRYTFDNWEDWFPFETLGYAATMSAVAYAYDWCYDYFTEEQRKEIEEKLRYECLELGFNIHNGRADINAREHLNGEHNRNAVISGSYIVGCIALMDKYPEEASALLEQVIKQLEIYGRCFYPGGAYDEGYTYWTYGMQYFNRATATLDINYGTDFGLWNAPGMDESPYWIIYGSSLNKPNNYGDSGSGSPTECMGDFGYIAQKLNDPGLEELRHLYFTKKNLTYTDIWYSTPGIAQRDIKDISAPLDSYFPVLEQINMRSAWGTDQATFLSAHGGESVPNTHAHLDTGAFVFEMLGERWVDELPAEDYSFKSNLAHNERASEVAAFGLGYNANPLCYLTRPEGHSTIVINPDYDAGHNFHANSPVTHFVSKEKGAYAIIDMSEVMRDDAKSSRRGYMLGDDRRSVIIRDEVEVIKPNSALWWFAYTQADKIDHVDDKTAILTKNGKQVKMQLASSDPAAKIQSGAAISLPDSPGLQKKSSADYTKIFITANIEKKGYIQVRFIPMTDPKANTEIADIALDNWEIADGPIIPLPTVDMLYRDGKALETFADDAYSYGIKLGEEEAVPQITADVSDIYDYTLTQATSVNEPTTIRIWLKEDPSIFADYVIKFEVIPKLSDYEGYERLSIYDITSNNVPQPENGPYNLIDEDIGTRHAMNSMDGAWTRFDLGKVVTVDAFAMAVFEGASRFNTFEIEVSLDGTNWTNAYSGKNSGTTAELEIYDIAPVQARYIRIVPKECSASATWYSTTEFYPMKKR